MDTLLKNGDFVKNAFGHPVTVEGYNEILQRVLIRLAVKRGSFILDKYLGSNLYMISNGNRVTAESEAVLYAREALMDMVNVQVLSANVQLSDLDTANVLVKVKILNNIAEIIVEL